MHRKKIGLICIIWFAIVLSTSGCHKETDEEKLQLSEIQPEEKKDTPEEPKEAKEIYVHVCGQVHNPGVYQLKNGSRIFQAIEAAGGIIDTAVADGINQAEAVEDGQQIYVPAQGELTLPQDARLENQQQVQDGKVNINAATKEELMTLNGIGEARADAVIKYREEHGSFETVEDLKKIEGIKDGIFNKIRELVKVS